MKRFQRFLASLLAICFAHATMLQTAQAALVTTEQLAQAEAATAPAQSPHARLAAALARTDVQAEMERLGLDPAIAGERIAALTDDEAAQLASHIDSAPAGGSDVLGAILLIFFVLLLTDILGFTKIFPFTRSVR